MVEFCVSCGASLARGDVTVRSGTSFTSPDYVCPECGKPANPEKSPAPRYEAPDADGDFAIRNGVVEKTN